LSNPAPKPAFTTRNTDAYHDVPAIFKTQTFSVATDARLLEMSMTLVKITTMK